MNKSTKSPSLFLAFYQVTVFFKEFTSELLNKEPETLSQTFVICAEGQAEALWEAYYLTPENFRVIGSKCELKQVILNL